jgi:hypothetical protein
VYALVAIFLEVLLALIHWAHFLVACVQNVWSGKTYDKDRSGGSQGSTVGRSQQTRFTITNEDAAGGDDWCATEPMRDLYLGIAISSCAAASNAGRR